MRKPKHDEKFYIKQINKYMEEIKITPKENGQRFLLLKKKAKKCVERIRELQALKKK